jgi:hypothetical protein
MELKAFEPIDMTEEQIAEHARSKATARAEKASNAINTILKTERCKIIPTIVIQAGQIVQHAIQVVPE